MGLPLALAAAAATSFHSQMELAHLIGWGYHLAWLLPTAVVIWEGVATVRWKGTPKAEEWKEARKDARRQAMLAVGTSFLLNSLWHINDPHASAPLAITLLVSAVPNIVTFFLLHGAMSGPAPAVPEEEVFLPVLPPEPELVLPQKPEEEVPPVVEPVAEEEVPPVAVKRVIRRAPEVRKEAAVPAPAEPEEEVVVPAARRVERKKRTLPERMQQCREFLMDVADSGRDVAEVKPEDLMALYGLGRRYWREILNDVRRERPADGWRRKELAAV